MIDRGSEVSVKRQAELLDVSRASVYYSLSVFGSAWPISRSNSMCNQFSLLSS
jgi:hypothetical protein